MAGNCEENNMSLVTRKPVFWVCDQARHKPACAATEASLSLEILAIASRGIVLSRQRTTKALIRLRRCADWSAPLLFTYGINRFSHDVVQYYDYYILSQSLNLGGRQGTTYDIATIPFHLSTFPCLPLPSDRALQTPFLSIPWRYLPISSFVFLLLLSPAELSSPCQRILRCGHTIGVPIPSPCWGDHHALQLHSGFCSEPPRSSHGLCRIIQYNFALNEPYHEKTCLCHMWTTKAQISLRICAV